ncbi:MAG: trigger factor [Alphaproteobacteria bacterium]|nr:MAG: trigger factor [Alphaproteobacteria bacterium]
MIIIEIIATPLRLTHQNNRGIPFGVELVRMIHLNSNFFHSKDSSNKIKLLQSNHKIGYSLDKLYITSEQAMHLMTESFIIHETEHQGLQRAYTVTISHAHIAEKINAELMRIGQKVKIPGFRPGKVPLSLLKQRYTPNALGDALEEAVQDALSAIYKQHNVMPALQPAIDVVEKYEENKPLVFTASFEIMPESPDLDLTSITLRTPIITITDEQVLERAKMFTDRRRTFNDLPEDTKAASGHAVRIDFKGFLGDEAFDGGEGSDYSLVLGSGDFIPGFEDQLIGAQAGEQRSVTVTFPDSYHEANLAGKEARFDVTIHQVQEAVTPELDDEFAKQIGFPDLEGLTTFMRRMIDREHEGIIRNYIKRHLFDALDPLCNFDIPSKMLELELESIMRQAKQEARANNEDETIIDAEREDYNAIAKRRVRLGIYLSQLAGRNNLRITEEDMQSALFAQARNFPGQEQKVIEFYQKNPRALQELSGPILEEKAVDYILGIVKREEVARTLDEIIAEEEAYEETLRSNKSSKDGEKSATDAKNSSEKEPSAKKKAASSSKKDDTDADMVEDNDATKKTSKKKDNA